MEVEKSTVCPEKDAAEDCSDDDDGGPWSEETLAECEPPMPDKEPDECPLTENSDPLNPWDEDEADDCDPCSDASARAAANTNKSNDEKSGCCQKKADGEQQRQRSCDDGRGGCGSRRDGSEGCGSSSGCQPATRECPGLRRPAKGEKAPECQECKGAKVQKTPEGKEIPRPCCRSNEEAEEKGKNNGNDCDCNRNNNNDCDCWRDDIHDDGCHCNYERVGNERDIPDVYGSNRCGSDDCRCQVGNVFNCNNNNNGDEASPRGNDNNNCGGGCCDNSSTNRGTSCGNSCGSGGGKGGCGQSAKRECPSLMRPTSGSKAPICPECEGRKVKKTADGKEFPCPCCQSKEAKKKAAESAVTLKGKDANANGNNYNNNNGGGSESPAKENRSIDDDVGDGNNSGSRFKVSLDNGTEIITRYFDDPSSRPPSLCPSQERPACPQQEKPPERTCPPEPSCPPKPSPPQPSCSQPSCSQPRPTCEIKQPSCPARKEECEETSLLERLMEKKPDKCCELGPVPYEACAAEGYFDKEDPQPKPCKKNVPKCGGESESKNPFAEWFANQDPCPRKPNPPLHPSCAAGCGADPSPPKTAPPYPCCPAEKPQPASQCQSQM